MFNFDLKLFYLFIVFLIWNFKLVYLYRVFANLLNNAIRASKNKKNIIIRLRLKQLNKNQQKQLLVHIKDSGSGIKQDNIQKFI